MTLVSIITPSYNQAAYLEQTIQSVLSQDYPAIEYILVDGGSTDGSLEIIEKYRPRFAWWVSELDSGQAEAINKGFSRATGEIIAWLNSDDLYLPGAISQAVAALSSNPGLGFVYGDAITIDAAGNPLSQLKFEDYQLLDLIGFRIICQPAVFMRRRVLEKAGYLDASYHFLLDHQLWIRLARQAPFQHVPATWAAARHHPAAKNVAQAAGFGQEAFRILDWMEVDSELAPLVLAHRRRIQAGAHRLNARYLLDGGFPAPSLRAYARALRFSPGFALKHWHRMLYAALSMLGGKGLAEWYYRIKRKLRRPPASSANLPATRQ
jgi:glycosyltransferase involved in cell wall biosynthesis